MKEDELASISTGVKLQGMLPYLSAELEAYKSSIENKVLMEIEKGTLTPDKALFYWMQLVAQKRLLQRLQMKITVGQYIGEKNSSVLDKLD